MWGCQITRVFPGHQNHLLRRERTLLGLASVEVHEVVDAERADGHPSPHAGWFSLCGGWSSRIKTWDVQLRHVSHGRCAGQARSREIIVVSETRNCSPWGKRSGAPATENSACTTPRWNGFRSLSNTRDDCPGRLQNS